ncbi:protein translocase subunit SecF [Sulfurivermis fontis]|uniref:protein translocase subunit SecF n=1 Tax=Sulfurivermis fontis TaxID=1972068 RepID=UPI000FD74414|nr:protein translocase subunit SecF [Sulfurivermis fontis]
MQIFWNTNIDFLGQRKLAMMVSILLFVVSIGALVTRGLNLGIDFTGGTLIELAYSKPAELSEVRNTLVASGYGDSVVQHIGSTREVMVRVPPREGMTSATLSNEVHRALEQAAGEKLDLRRVEFVGPQVGKELLENGGLAILYALIGILIYVALRFEYRLGVGAIIALIHDPVLILGLFALFQWNFDLTVLAAILAVIGYSLNDTIVVYDRIRENFRKLRKATPVEVVNASINQTLSRTVLTSGTTLLVVLALVIFGGEMIRGFAIAFLIGILVGTYSSVYVASAAALALGISKENLMPVKKEGEGEEEMENLP